MTRRFEVDNVHLEEDSLNVMYKKEKGIAPIHSLFDHVFDLCLHFNNLTMASFV